MSDLEDIEELEAGDYCVTVTDALCGIASFCWTVHCCKQFNMDDLTYELEQPASCESKDGSIEFNGRFGGIRNGTHPFSYRLFDIHGNVFYPAPTFFGGIFEELKNGKYILEATDANGCTGQKEFTLMSPDGFIIYNYELLHTCSNQSDGKITLHFYNFNFDDTEKFKFSWSTGEVDDNITINDAPTLENLSNGTYCVTISSYVTGCVLEDCWEIQDGSKNETLEMSADVVMPCGNFRNGQINLKITGGTQPYKYLWNPLVSAPKFLGEGHYCVTVTDFCGSSAEDCFDLISLKTDLEFSYECKDKGIAKVKIEGCNPPITIDWYSSQSGHIGTGQEIHRFIDGDYRVIIKDKTNCETNTGFTLKYENKNYVSSVNNVTNCTKDDETCDGYIKISVKGNKNYIYLWTGPNGFISSDRDISNLCIGVYKATITESNGCKEYIEVEICCCNAEENSEKFRCVGITNSLTINYNAVAPKNNFSKDGSIDLSVSGGTGQYFYKWNGPDEFKADIEDITMLIAGRYCVIVADGCQTDELCIDLKSCGDKSIVVNGNILNTCEQLAHGKISLNINGLGTPPFKYIWSNGKTTKDIEELGVGTYCVTVTDAQGCSATNCFNMGTHPEDHEPNTEPCGTQYKCNSYDTRFEPSYDYFVSYAGCNIKNIHCALTGGIIRSEALPFMYFRINWRDCTMEALCPVSGEWVPYATGVFFSDYYLIKEPNCECYGCYLVTFCIIGNQVSIYDIKQVNPDICGPPSGLIYSVIQGDLRLNEFLYLFRKSNVLVQNYELLLPPMVSDTMYLKEYNNILDSLRNIEAKLLLVVNDNANKLDSINCSTLRCSGLAEDYLNERFLKGNPTIKPNPFTSNITIALDKNRNEKVTVTLYDAIGNTVLEKVFNNQENHIEYTLNTGNYPVRIYFIKISGDKNIVKKIIKNNN